MGGVVGFGKFVDGAEEDGEEEEEEEELEADGKAVMVV